MASLLPNQADVWNEKHTNDEHAAHRAPAMPLAKQVTAYFPKNPTILEIGCGTGADSTYFAQQGYVVTATDISKVVIGQNKQYYKDLAIDFRELDASQQLPFKQDQFDVVYSHLALHYFTHETTQAVFNELSRVLKSGGILAFACKSTNDALYGEGEEIEPDMFVRKGHVRHFFSLEYTKSLLGDAYEILVLEEVQERYAKHASSMIHCIARKRETHAG